MINKIKRKQCTMAHTCTSSFQSWSRSGNPNANGSLLIIGLKIKVFNGRLPIALGLLLKTIIHLLHY